MTYLPTPEYTREPIIVNCLCPCCGQSIELGRDCDKCGQIIMHDGVADFVCANAKSDEVSFYDAVYSARTGCIPSPESLRLRWEDDPDAPQNNLILQALGDLKGQTVLLLGNGASDKELHFLALSPNALIYSDLSREAMARLEHSSLTITSNSRLALAAIDAMKMPFPDHSLDVVYGYAMVHHLPDTAAFIHEASRVLKPGGRAVFYDDAFSPLWHRLKTGWLARLRRISQQRTGISPEDLKFSDKGGFRESELALLIQDAGADPWFRRCSLIQYVLHRGASKMLPPELGSIIRQGWLARICTRADKLAADRSQPYADNQVRLVWGFTKPLLGG